MSLIFQTDPIPTSRKRHGLYLGSKGDAKSRSKLEAWGVTHILNMTPEKEAGIKVNMHIIMIPGNLVPLHFTSLT